MADVKSKRTESAPARSAEGATDSGDKWAPTRRSEHAALDAFVGRWTIEGRNGAGAPGAAGLRVTGEESYEWLPGKFFLVCRFDRRFEDGSEHRGLGVVGQWPEKAGIIAQNYDNLGYARAYQMSHDAGTWTYSGQWERATVVFDGEDTMTARWEVSADGSNWLPLCELTGTRTV